MYVAIIVQERSLWGDGNSTLGDLKDNGLCKRSQPEEDGVCSFWVSSFSNLLLLSAGLLQKGIIAQVDLF